MVINASSVGNFRIQEVMTVRYVDTDILDKIIREARAVLQEHSGIDQQRPILVHFTAFGPSGLKLSIDAFTMTSDRKIYRDVQQDVCLKMLQLMAHNGSAPI